MTTILYIIYCNIIYIIIKVEDISNIHLSAYYLFYSFAMKKDNC
eukprot:UN05862